MAGSPSMLDSVKLTLSVDRDLIDKAKRYARRHDKSLSDLVSSYLRQITADEQDANDVDPLVRDVADEIPMDQIMDLGDARCQHLKAKYLRG